MSSCVYCGQGALAAGCDGPVCPDCWEQGYGRKPAIAGLRTPVKVMSVDAMADRIEELEAENRRLRLEVQHANDVADVAIEQAKELEALLAKVVEALDNVVKEYDLFRKYEYERGLSSLDDEIEDARTTLAELKGTNQ